MGDQRIRYLKEQEVAEITGISIQTLRNNRSTKRSYIIPYIRLGRKMIRYDPRDIQDYMEKHKVK